MGALKAFLCLLLIGSLLLCCIAEEPLKEDDGGPEETMHINFLKVLSALLVRKIPLPAEVKTSVKSVIRELLNGQPRKEGYMSYLYVSMLRVAESRTEVQMDTMLSVMEESSPQTSVMAKAAKILREWLKTEAGRAFIENVSMYIKNLFERNRKFLPKVPGIQNGGPGGDEENRIHKPATLPASIEEKNGVVGREALGNRLTKFRYIDIQPGKIIIGPGAGAERRPPSPGRPGRPEDRDRYPDNRPGGNRDRYPDNRPGGNRDRYPDNRPGGDRDRYPDNRPGGDRDRYPEHGHYPENNRPHGPPRPGGGHYPEDRPHNHPRPGGGNYPNEYPEGRPPHGKPTVDKVCIERVPAGGNYRPRSSRLLTSNFK